MSVMFVVPFGFIGYRLVGIGEGRRDRICTNGISSLPLKAPTLPRVSNQIQGRSTVYVNRRI